MGFIFINDGKYSLLNKYFTEFTLNKSYRSKIFKGLLKAKIQISSILLVYFWLFLDNEQF